jgi:hypothetical protein
MSGKDQGIDNLLVLDGERFVIDEKLGLWIKIDAKLITPASTRPHGIKYALTLHDRFNTRIMGFDNAHAINDHGTYDHWHKDQDDKGRLYKFINAGKLLEDFWVEVDKMIKKLER